jgi:hypothetical protein
VTCANDDCTLGNDDVCVVCGDLYDPFGALDRALARAGLRATFDPARNVTRPCIGCGATNAPRKLVTVGAYDADRGGNIRAGDPISRPMCARCEAGQPLPQLPPAPADKEPTP